MIAFLLVLINMVVTAFTGAGIFYNAASFILMIAVAVIEVLFEYFIFEAVLPYLTRNKK